MVVVYVVAVEVVYELRVVVEEAAAEVELQEEMVQEEAVEEEVQEEMVQEEEEEEEMVEEVEVEEQRSLVAAE